VKEFMSKVKLIRKYFPDAGITTDVIVGFPTETKEDFMETYKTCEKIGFSWIHVFPYSKRDGTVASLMKSVVTGDEVKQRSKKLTDLAIVSRENFAKKMKGTVQDLIIEQEKDGFFTGHSGNFIKCYLKSNKNIKLNQMVKVEIGQNYLDGALCEIWVPKV